MENKKYSLIIVAILFLSFGLIAGKYLTGTSDDKPLPIESQSVKVQSNGDTVVSLRTLSGKVGTGEEIVKKYKYDCYDKKGYVAYWLITQTSLPAGTELSQEKVDYRCKYMGAIN